MLNIYIQYKTTIKSLVRSPTMILAILGGIMLLFANGVGVNGGYYGWEAFAAAISNQVNFTTKNFLPAFIGVIVGFDIFRDKDNNFSEILDTTQISFLKYYIAKLSAYFSIAFVGCITVVFVYHLLFLASVNITFEYNIILVLKMYLFRMIWILPNGILVYMSIAVFFSALFGKGGMGIIFSIIYVQIYYLFMPFFNSKNFFVMYIYHVPPKILNYIFYWGTDRQEIFVKMLSGKIGVLNFGNMLLSFCIQIGISVILLIAGGAVIRKRSM